MKKIIVGLVGIIASGKDTVADYLVDKYQAEKISFSDPLRDVLNRLYLPIDRAHMSGLSQILIDKFGGDLLSRVIAREIEKSDKVIFVLPNIRRESDYSALEKFPGFVLVGIKTDQKICYERLIKRNQNSDDQTKTREQFQKDLGLSTEVLIPHLVDKSSFKLENNGSLDDLYKQADRLIDSLSKI